MEAEENEAIFLVLPLPPPRHTFSSGKRYEGRVKSFLSLRQDKQPTDEYILVVFLPFFIFFCVSLLCSSLNEWNLFLLSQSRAMKWTQYIPTVIASSWFYLPFFRILLNRLNCDYTKSTFQGCRSIVRRAPQKSLQSSAQFDAFCSLDASKREELRFSAWIIYEILWGKVGRKRTKNVEQLHPRSRHDKQLAPTVSSWNLGYFFLCSFASKQLWT